MYTEIGRVKWILTQNRILWHSVINLNVTFWRNRSPVQPRWSIRGYFASLLADILYFYSSLFLRITRVSELNGHVSLISQGTRLQNLLFVHSSKCLIQVKLMLIRINRKNLTGHTYWMNKTGKRWNINQLYSEECIISWTVVVEILYE